MCRSVTGFWILIIALFAHKASAQQYAFQVTFTDKNNTPYSLSSPSAYLSPRALLRRTTQGIAIDSTDLPVNPAYIDSIVTLTSGIFYETSRWLNMCIILLPRADSAQIIQLTGKPFISNISLVGSYCTDVYGRHSNTTGPGATITTAQRTTNADDIYYNDTWTQTQLVNGSYLHDKGYNGEGKLIAVLDAGFLGANTHPGFDSMWSSGRMVDTFDFTFHNTDVFLQDVHGMEVLSTMAGYVPGTFVGSAPRAMYALYVTENNTDDQPVELDNMIAATERADSIGADIITESLGYDVFLSACSGQSYPQLFASLDGVTTIAAKAANIATKKGILFVATAGNDGTGIPGWGTHILTPGDADSALTIGAVDDTGIPADFSGYGPNAVERVKPDVCGLGVNAAVFNVAGGYETNNGTSFSTPQIAGWAACLWEANPTATPYQVRQAIIKCASSYNTPGTQLGYGVPNFQCTEQALNVRDTPLPFSAANWVIATPNPFSDEIKLSVSPDEDGFVGLKLIDVTGRIAFAMYQYFYRGYNTPFTISVPSLPDGMYMLRAVSATKQQVTKLEKLH